MGFQNRLMYSNTMQAQPVLEVITNRLHYQQLGLPYKSDGLKLGQAVEGGGMRGVMSAGMLMALSDLQLLDIFDVFTGTSAGSVNLAYVLSGQKTMGLSLYFENMIDPVNLNKRRLFDDDHAMMDLRNVYVDTQKQKRLQIERLLITHGKSLFVGVTNLSRNEGELITPYEAGDRFFEYIVAGATLPFIAGDPWIIKNQKYYDGGLYYIDPYQAAEQLGCTHVLVLQTHRWGYALKPYGAMTQRVFKRLDEDYPAAGTSYIQRVRESAEIQANLSYGETDVNSLHLYRHAVKVPLPVGRLTTDREKLMDGAKIGYQSVLDLFAPGALAGIEPSIM